MGEYEPRDSRNVTLKDGHVPGEPPRTGPREGQSRTSQPKGEDTLHPEQDGPKQGGADDAGAPVTGKATEGSWRDSERR